MAWNFKALILRVLAFCVLSILPTAQTAGNAQTADAKLPTFRAQSRLVQVDVVVLDNGGRPLAGLKSSDFTVLEEGKAQSLTAFEAHEAVRAPAPPQHFHLPAHQYTNVPEEETRGPLTVILFDTLNTPSSDQITAHRNMLQFLKSLPPGHRTALFTLGTSLRLIQTFTGDSDVLVQVADKILSSPSTLTVTESQRQQDEDNLALRERMMAPASAPPSGLTPTGSAGQGLSMVSQRLRDAFALQEEAALRDRIDITVKSLSELAVMLHGYSGRKNLLWLSGSFPFSFGPNPLLRSEARDTTNFGPAIHRATDLLSSAQVAVYPIDAAGVKMEGPDFSSNGEGSSGVNNSTGISRMNSSMGREFQEQSDVRSTMDDIADQTGGKAFYGTNDLKNAMQRSVDQGSTYYTLSYVPQNQDWNGKFRRIEVKLDHGGTKLQYRRGYFAFPESKRSPDDSTRQLAISLHPDMPDSSALYLKAEVMPPDATHSAVRITYLINAQQITFTDTSNGKKHAFVDLLAVAWDKAGKDVGHAADTIDATLDMNQYRRVLRAGLQATQELPIQAGAYRVSLGAVDRLSQHVGTISVVLNDMGKP